MACNLEQSRLRSRLRAAQVACNRRASSHTCAQVSSEEGVISQQAAKPVLENLNVLQGALEQEMPKELRCC